MPSISGEAVIFALAIGIFVLTIIGLVAALSILRQRREWKRQKAADTIPSRPKDLSEALKKAVIVTAPTTPAPQSTPTVTSASPPDPVPENPHSPTPEDAPDQVVIQIDPAEGPTHEQLNVQRLIDHFKDESKPEDSAKSN